MWVCKECGGEIRMWEETVVHRNYKLKKQEKIKPFKRSTGKHEETEDYLNHGYYCCVCDKSVSEMGEIEDIAEWIK